MSTVPFKVKAIYEYSSPHDDDLGFPQGQIITVTEEEDDDWYSGEYVDSTGGKHEGIFPRNFVERYEPEIPLRPARPTRTKKDPEATVPAAVAAAKQSTSREAITAAPGRDDMPERPVQVSSPQLATLTSPSASQSPGHQAASNAAVKTSEQPPAKPISKDIPTEEHEKPSGGSFRDRIAAFNKPAAPPIAPFKPGGQSTSSSTGFIKKPFVAPPPSKNAYVPPPREAPPSKVYRREEDAGFNEAAEDSEASMPLPGERVEVGGDVQPKPTSLKDRIALLQKQQLEQAARHAEAAQKKEKPKRPPKKRTESQDPTEISEAPAGADPEGFDTPEAIGKKSVDFNADDEAEPLGRQGGRQPFIAAHMSTPPPPSRELMSDTNDADNSAAGDTEEAYDTSTSREDNRERSKGEYATTNDQELVSEPAEVDRSDEEPEEEEHVDPEIKRRMEIRERMAKMSGGMGLMGMFGPPGGMPTPGKKAKASGDGDKDISGTQGQTETVERAPPVPVPGMVNIKSPERKPSQAEADSSAEEDAIQIPARQSTTGTEQPDEEMAEPPRPPPRTSTDRGPPAVSQGMYSTECSTGAFR
jgi:myosin tail region-interacting protein MTI1